MTEELLQFVGLQCFLLAQAQGENVLLRQRIAEMEAQLSAKPRRKKAE